MEDPPHLNKFGIALSGGGARGILHIGVLEALNKYGIYPDIISGTSMGALVGVLYAAGMKPLEILGIVKTSKMHQMINWKLPSRGLLEMKKLHAIIKEHIPTDDFSALVIPFHCSVSNLNSGLPEIKNSGQLIHWVLASATIPVFFEPQIINGETYVDGGLFNNMPTECIRNQCNFLIGVHVNHNEREEKIEGFKATAERTFRLLFAKDIDISLELCDLIIDPSETRFYNTFDFAKADELFQIGFNVTEKKILELLSSGKLNQI